jgi:hypothetical protein
MVGDIEPMDIPLKDVPVGRLLRKYFCTGCQETGPAYDDAIRAMEDGRG